jgi:hypothetical protein
VPLVRTWRRGAEWGDEARREKATAWVWRGTRVECDQVRRQRRASSGHNPATATSSQRAGSRVALIRLARHTGWSRLT